MERRMLQHWLEPTTHKWKCLNNSVLHYQEQNRLSSVSVEGLWTGGLYRLLPDDSPENPFLQIR